MRKSPAEKALEIISELYDKAKHGRTAEEIKTDPVFKKARLAIERANFMQDYEKTLRRYND